MRLFRLPGAILREILGLPGRFEAAEARIDEAKVLAARSLIHQVRARGVLADLREAEFDVFSQFGDDGIIQYLVHRAAPAPRERVFVEFGVGDYRESNTRFLLVNDNWRGLVMDRDAGNVAAIRGAPWFWKYDLTAAAAFVDRDNVDGLIAGHGFSGDIGLLHIDIDGNDYWVWEALSAVRPAVAVIEYNAVFGAERAVAVPYDPAFDRTRAHFSNLYWGCSLKALCGLAERKGYAFVGANGNGNNAYFVRTDRLGDLPARDARSGFVPSRYRESRDPAGRLTFLAGADRLRAIAEMPLVDLETGKRIKAGDLAGERS